MVAQGSNFRIQHDLSTSLERLSTGLRINRASDDAAGLSVSEKLRAQVKGSQIAQRNTSDAISFLKIADGALNEMTNIVQRMREIAVQGSSDTYTRTERAYMEQEYEALRNELDRISKNTQYNGITIFEKNTSANLLPGWSGANNSNGRYGNAAIEIESVGLNPLAGIQNITYEEGITTNDETGGRVFSFQVGPNGPVTVGSGATYDIYNSQNMLNIALPDMSTTAIFLTGLVTTAFTREDAQTFNHTRNDTANPINAYARDGVTTVWVFNPAPLRVYMSATQSCENTIAIIDGNGRGNVSGGEGNGVSNRQVAGLRRINAVRSYVGSLINRLEHSQNNLTNQTNNMQNAESKIRDADFGSETASFTRNQILAQSSTAMISQSNMMPGYVLSLLK